MFYQMKDRFREIGLGPWEAATTPLMQRAVDSGEMVVVDMSKGIQNVNIYVVQPLRKPK